MDLESISRAVILRTGVVLCLGAGITASVGCVESDGVAAQQSHATPAASESQELHLEESLDDKVFSPLHQAIANADDIVLGEIHSVSRDGKLIDIRILRSARERLQIFDVITIPNPRLEYRDRFDTLQLQSQFVFLLVIGADARWHTPEFGDESAFRVRNGEILLPRFYKPGQALPAEGLAGPIPLDAFFSIAGSCASRGEDWCSRAIEKVFDETPG